MIIEFNNFLNEGKRQKGEKLNFDDWWAKGHEKRNGYWVTKSELKKGYTEGDLTQYKERKMRSKFNKYLKKK